MGFYLNKKSEQIVVIQFTYGSQWLLQPKHKQYPLYIISITLMISGVFGIFTVMSSLHVEDGLATTYLAVSYTIAIITSLSGTFFIRTCGIRNMLISSAIFCSMFAWTTIHMNLRPTVYDEYVSRNTHLESPPTHYLPFPGCFPSISEVVHDVCHSKLLYESCNVAFGMHCVCDWNRLFLAERAFIQQLLWRRKEKYGES